MADVSPTNRLVRKRNSNLQKQLDVTLQILSEEYRLAKERMYKEERDCGKFLQSLYNTVPGLHTYGQPDTRAMNSNSLLKERRYSMSVSVISGSDGEDLHSALNPPFKPARSIPAPATESRPSSDRPDGRGPKPFITEAPGNRTASNNNGSQTALSARDSPSKKRGEEARWFVNRPSSDGGSRALLSGRDRPAKNRRAGGGRSLNIPSTASTQKNGDDSSPERKGQPKKLTSNQGGPVSPWYGKNAYTEHDRTVQDKVLKKFDVIFNPETEARKVNLGTITTPIVVVQPESDNSNNRDCNNNSVKTRNKPQVKVNGEDFQLRKKSVGSKRVIWSARPHRNQQDVTAPSSARVDRPKSEISHTARPTTSRLYSSSLSLLTTNPKPLTVRSPPHLLSIPGRLDSRIQSLAHQRNLVARYSRQDDQSDSSSESETDKQTQNMAQPNEELQGQFEPSVETQNALSVQQNQQDEQTRANCHLITQSSQQDGQNHTCHPKLQPSQQEGQSHTKFHLTSQPGRQGKQTQTNYYTSVQQSQGQQTNTMRDPSNLLQVPSPQPHPHQQPNGTPLETNGSPQTAVRNNSILRPSSRLSDTNDRTPPVELWSRLLKAGLPGRAPKRPKTAPSKSELSHRSMPAPRQTVVGILAQIENQKANTRAMINTSKELQQVVKKLVPWEQPPAHDWDDW